MQIPKIPWLNDWELNFKDYFVDLTIESNSDGEKKALNLHELFRPIDGDKPTRILIEGPAGYGKSTLASKLCYDHASGEEYIQSFAAVILLRLRDFQTTLDELILETLHLQDYSDDDILKAMRSNDSKILFILDGFDELSKEKHVDVSSLLMGSRFPRSTVITTTRLGCISLSNVFTGWSTSTLAQCVNSRVTIKGLTGSNKLGFINLYLGHSPAKLESIIKLVDDKFAGLFKSNLFDCPLFLLLLVILAEEADISSLKTKTELFKTLFNFMLKRMLFKQGTNNENCDYFLYNIGEPPTYVQTLSQFGSLAMKALEERQYTFTEEQLVSQMGNDDILKLGILTQNDSRRGLRRESWFEPVHLSFLEFPVAYFLWTRSMSKTKGETFLRLCSNNGPFAVETSLVWSFLFGLYGKKLATFWPILGIVSKSETWLNDFISLGISEELQTESQLTISELTEAFLPLVSPGEKLFTVDRLPKLDFEKKKLTEPNISQNCVEIQYSVILYQPDAGRSFIYPTVTPGSVKSLQNYTAITHQGVHVLHHNTTYVLEVTVCEDSLEEQLEWLSDWLRIEGLLPKKPIYNITYEGSEMIVTGQLILTGQLSKITALIRGEKVKGLKFSFGTRISLNWWREFVSCANESKQLLAMEISTPLSKSLFLVLSGIKGKKWKNVALNGKSFIRFLDCS